MPFTLFRSTGKAREICFDRNAEFLARPGALCRLLAGSSRERALTARCQSVALLWLLKYAWRLTFDGMLTPTRDTSLPCGARIDPRLRF
ncbi:hypothetical protein PQR34_43190 [Paraburkholderia sediminicola]|uniref:hypothetical protein n=1 Tax=Paraburkholderia TaxID=1822464 RepID=UPI00105FC5A0